MKFTVNFKADTPTMNNHVYPKNVLKKAFDDVINEDIFVLSKAPTPTSFESADLEDIIGKYKDYDISESGNIVIDVDVYCEDKFNDKEITTYGIGNLNENNVISDDFVLCGFFVCDKLE